MRRSRRRKHFRVFFAPALFVFAVLLIRYDVPLRLGFDLSRAAFSRVVHDAVRSNGAIYPGWTGLYAVTSARLITARGKTPAVVLSLDETGGREGFVYYLKDPPASEIDRNHYRLIDSWFVETAAVHWPGSSRPR